MRKMPILMMIFKNLPKIDNNWIELKSRKKMIKYLNSWNKKQKCKIKLSSIATNHLFYFIISYTTCPWQVKYCSIYLFNFVFIIYLWLCHNFWGFLIWTYDCDKVTVSGIYQNHKLIIYKYFNTIFFSCIHSFSALPI